MRPGHIKLPTRPEDEAVKAARAAAFERKQKWKEIPGNRYTPEELKQMSGEFADCAMRRPKRRIMHIA